MADVSAALLVNQRIYYGTHFVLRGSPVGDLVVICSSGPWADPAEPGQFLLYLDDEQLSQGASREEAVAHLALGLESAV